MNLDNHSKFSDFGRDVGVAELMWPAAGNRLSPVVQHEAGPFGDHPGDKPKESISRFVQVLVGQKWKILAFMALALVMAAVVTRMMQKLYEGTATIKLEAKSSAGMIGQQNSPATNDMDQIITTEIEIVQSDPVLRPVVEKYHLLDMEKQTKGLKTEDLENLRKAPIKLARLNVKRPPNTYLILISYRAPTPALAAEVTNAIAESYLLHAFDSKNRSYAEASGLIARQLQDLRARAAQSASVLTSFERELGMVDPEQRTTILSTRLLQLNQEYTAAQADRMKKEADDKQNQVPTVASAEASAQGQSVERAVERLGEARRHFATVSSVYAENSAEYKKARNQVTELESQVTQLRDNTRDRVHSDYMEALDREKGVAGLLAQTKKEFEMLSARTYQFQQLKRDADNDRKLYEDLDRHAREGDINNGFEDTVIQISSRARPPLEKIFPKLSLNLAIAFILSGIVGIGIALISDAVDSMFSDEEEVAARMGIDVLCRIPAVKGLPRVSVLAAASGEKPELPEGETTSKRELAIDAYGETIRGLRNTISMTRLDRNLGSILMTSSHPGDGKSTIAAQLALTFALVGKKTLLIDADLRRGTVHNHFNLHGGNGLADVLMGRVKWSEAVVKIEKHPLWVMPSGYSNRASDLIGPGIAELLNRIGHDYDVVLVDGPPLAFAETQQLAGVVDSVLVVAKPGTTTGKALADTFTTLGRTRANLMGLVLNQVKVAKGSNLGSYYYGGYNNKRKEVVGTQQA